MYVYFIAMGDNDQVMTEEQTEKILKNENVQKFLVQFVKVAEDAVPLLKEYISAIPEICLKLQEWIDDLAVQETAVNVVNTTTTTVGAVSTVLLFTPLAPFGIAGLVGSGIDHFGGFDASGNTCSLIGKLGQTWRDVNINNTQNMEMFRPFNR